MKNLIILYCLALSCLFSCKKTEAKNIQNQNIAIENDTIINNSCVLLLTPDDKEIIELKKKHGEDNFYTIADDANYYISEINNESSEKIRKTHHKIINFPKEKYVFNKSSQENKWLIIEYNTGTKPKIYSLVDYYSYLNNGSATTKKTNEDLAYYINNDGYFIKDIDINKDGLKDKIVSHKKNMGEDLLFFLNDGTSNYNLKLKTYNFSEDGGFVMGDILPIYSKNSNEIFYIRTYFEGSDGAEKLQYISFQNGKWFLEKTLYITSNWRNNPNIEYHCEIKQNLNLDDKNLIDKLKPMPDESIWNKVCTTKSISSSSIDDFEKDVKNSTNINLEEIKKIVEQNPINNKNITQYNNIAYSLQQNGNFNESLFLINEILKKDPNRVVAYLNLADTNWNLNNKQNAKTAYLKYISLMKSQNKDLSKIPQRVYERSK